MKDLKIHHGQLLHQLDVLVEERNDLQEKINNSTQHKDFRSPLLLQIDEWQKLTMERVKQAAEQARRQVIEVVIFERENMKIQFDKLSQELVRLKETEDFAENDLERLKQTMRLLNQNLRNLIQPSTVELHVEQGDKIAWNRLIYVENKSTAKQQHQQQVTGGCFTNSY
jgi:hypothetical protein